MTVSYSRQVATSEVGTFARLLFRWRGSIYKLMYREVMIFLAFYAVISCVYRYALTDPQRHQFEQFALFCEETAGMIPITFILGFYVSLIVGRWWNIFLHITYPDRLMLQVSCYLTGTDERSRMTRRTIARYTNLSQLLVLRDISSVVRKRFPTMQHMIEGGFITEEELKLYESMGMVHHKFWMPLQWICSLIIANRKEGRIENDQQVVRMVNEVLNLRTSINTLLSYDWISVPLVYTQVVTIAVYSYFLASIFARQYLDPSKRYAHHEVDMYFPFFTLLQFIFYMGWLKVAESIMNPLGEDDDDFEVNYIIERNLQVGYAMADDNAMRIPPLKRDIHWNEPEAAVPHTHASAGLKDNPYVPSATNVDLKAESADAAVSRAASSASMANGILRKLSTRSFHSHHSPSRSGAKNSVFRLFSTVTRPFHRSSRELNDLEEEPGDGTVPGLDDILLNPNDIIPRGRTRSISLQHTRPSVLFTVHETNERASPVLERDSSSGPRRKNNQTEELQPLVPEDSLIKPVEAIPKDGEEQKTDLK